MPDLCHSCLLPVLKIVKYANLDLNPNAQLFGTKGYIWEIIRSEYILLFDKERKKKQTTPLSAHK